VAFDLDLMATIQISVNSRLTSGNDHNPIPFAIRQCHPALRACGFKRDDFQFEKMEIPVKV